MEFISSVANFIIRATLKILFWSVLTTGSLIAADVAAVAFCMKVYRGFKLPPKPTAEQIEVYQS